MLTELWVHGRSGGCVYVRAYAAAITMAMLREWFVDKRTHITVYRYTLHLEVLKRIGL